jgi:hypothetical protein
VADYVGQHLGNYRLIRLLGSGGFADVYLGEHLRLGTQAAVKVLSTRLTGQDDMVGFEKEARTVAHLKHPHIVQVLDYAVEEDTPFLIMDYAAGGTLRHRHPKGACLPFPTIIAYVIPLCVRGKEGIGSARIIMQQWPTNFGIYIQPPANSHGENISTTHLYTLTRICSMEYTKRVEPVF